MSTFDDALDALLAHVATERHREAADRDEMRRVLTAAESHPDLGAAIVAASLYIAADDRMKAQVAKLATGGVAAVRVMEMLARFRTDALATVRAITSTDRN